MMSVFTESLLYDLIVIITTLLVGVTAYFKWKLTYWDKVGLPTLNPSFPFGDTKGLLLGSQSFGEQFHEIYKQLKSKGHPHGGIYFGAAPYYVVTDPEMVKHVLQKDFQYFVNHGNYVNEKNDPLTGHLFNLENARWKNMRVKLTPTFTSGKMKMMFQTLADCTEGLKDIMDESAESRTSVEIKDVLGRFTTDIIGSAAFGLNCNSLKDPNTEFRIYGKKVFDADTLRRINLLLQFVLPHKLLDLFKYKITNTDVENFFMKVVRETVAYRENNKIQRKDFMHLLLQLKNHGKLTDDDDDSDVKADNGTSELKPLTMNEVTAQAFIFFLAGFETSSTTMTFALYEIATNPDVQNKMREEINTVLEKHNGQLTYDGIMQMTYMDKVLFETLRKYPPVSILTRQCTKDYVIPETSICLKKGIQVVIPVLGLHSDPEYYPNPDKFDPERFSEENKNSRPAFTWIPFGEGPRICIGLRFGLLQSKVGLTTLLKNYKIKLDARTKRPLQFEKGAFITTAKGGVWLEVEKLNKNI